MYFIFVFGFVVLKPVEIVNNKQNVKSLHFLLSAIKYIFQRIYKWDIHFYFHAQTHYY